MSAVSGASADPQPLRVLVVGAGLLGTSVGLALRVAGWPVWVSDVDAHAEALAADLGAGERGWPAAAPDLVLVAVPPVATSAVILDVCRKYPESTLTDVASVKSKVIDDLESFAPSLSKLEASAGSGGGSPGSRWAPPLLARYVGGHPLAGRERSGPAAARGDLFAGQPWVLSPGPTVPEWRVAQVRSLVEAVGGLPVVQSAASHDAAVALVSHLPQLVASLLAARLVEAPDEALALAGSGLRDTTRVAGSDAELWTQILQANAGPMAFLLDRLAGDLDQVRAAMRTLAADRHKGKSTKRDGEESAIQEARDVLHGLLAAGRAGRARIPGKHGGRAVEYAVVPVVVPDQPGALARLFVAAGEAGVNIEDVSIEHSPGQPVGLVELRVAHELADELGLALRERGWMVH